MTIKLALLVLATYCLVIFLLSRIKVIRGKGEETVPFWVRGIFFALSFNLLLSAVVTLLKMQK